jgi:GH15 family glucan-1,4-alpha-glucosidase
MPRDLPVGNGTVLVNFDHNYGLRDIYYPHVGEDNQTLGHICRFGVYVDGQFSWVGQGWEIDAKYLPDTLVTEVKLRNNQLQLELVVNDAVEFYLWVFLRRIEVKDLSGKNRTVKVFFHHDFHISENAIGDTAFYDPLTSSLIHYKRDRWFLINARAKGGKGLTQWACGKKDTGSLEGTWRDAEDGTLSGNPIAQGSVDSVVGVDVPLAANGTGVVHYWLCFGLAYEKVVKLNNIILEKGCESYIERTKNFWRLWVDKDHVCFAGLPPELFDLYKRSLLILRTQIDEGGAAIAATDQDIASYAHDTYSYMWPRDGALTIYALTRANYRELGERFFHFCLNVIREEGFFLHKYNPDQTVASSWLPWLRNGEFELPIQEDETALVLWSLWKHFDKFQDVDVIKPFYRRLIVNAADFMIRHKDADTGLPLPSWDLWEERYGVHLFTVSAVIGGLTAASKFAQAFGEISDAERYMAAATDMRDAMLRYMWSEKDGRFARMATRSMYGYELDMTPDAANFGVFYFEALPPDDARVAATMKSINDVLRVKTAVGGLARYVNDNYQQVSQDTANVPGNPWFICTMWYAQWQIACAKTMADLEAPLATLQWVCKRALPSGVLAEQIDPYTNAPVSVSPLTWSHATYMLCILEYVEKRQYILEGKGKVS